MKMYEIKLSVTTCYLVKAQDKYILIDTGYDYDWTAFQKGLQGLGVSLGQVSHIILTHHHDDHCGLLHKVLAENPDIRVVMHPLCKDLLLTGMNDRTHGGGLVNKRISALFAFEQFLDKLGIREKKRTLTFQPYAAREQDVFVREGTTLRDIGIGLDGRFMETPGHSADSISVLFDDGDCVVGDAAADMLSIFGTKHCVIYISNLEDYYRSWAKIISADAKRIVPAHGRPFSVDELKKDIHRNKAKNIVQN